MSEPSPTPAGMPRRQPTATTCPSTDELRTVRCIAKNIGRNEIARQQRIPRGEVDNRVGDLLKRYRSNNVGHLVVLFLKNGWLLMEEL